MNPYPPPHIVHAKKNKLSKDMEEQKEEVKEDTVNMNIEISDINNIT